MALTAKIKVCGKVRSCYFPDASNNGELQTYLTAKRVANEIAIARVAEPTHPKVDGMWIYIPPVGEPFLVAQDA